MIAKELQKKYRLQDLLAEGQVITPCIWDGFSARAAEISGFKSALVSSAAVAYSLTGLPDIGLMSGDEMIEIVARLAFASPLALIIDCEGGYGDTPMHAYRTVKRLADAGAAAIMMADSCGNGGVERMLYGQKPSGKPSTLPRDEWLAKIAASVEAVKGTDCMVIARTGCYSQDFDEAIVRVQKARELGSHMSLICGVTTRAQCEKMSKMVEGPKMYPDIISQNGVPDMEFDELEKLGFGLISVHFLEKGAFDGSIRYLERIQKDKNTVWVDQHDMGGKGIRDWFQQMDLYVNHRPWMKFEDDCFKSATEVLEGEKVCVNS